MSVLPAAAQDNTIKVGILHSLSGTMSISETAVKNAEMMAIDEINAAGGVLGKQLVPVVEDGASDWPTFAEKARKLIQEDKVSVIFGCWTSASRKAVLPVVEQLDGLLFYPVQYEGLEESPNIVYTGATTNQQIVPAVQWLLDQGKTKFFLLGSDYVFPRTANTIIAAQLAASGLTPVGTEYVPLGGTDFTSIMTEIQSAQPDVIFNTLNGDSNVAFFKQFTDAGYTADTLPVLSVSIAEQEVKAMGVENITGQLTSWNYYQTIDTPENAKFVADYKAKYGADEVTDDPMEAGYFGVYLWKEAVEKAGTDDIDTVRATIHAGGISYAAPEGTVSIDGPTQHTVKAVRIGKIREDGLIDTIFSTDPVVPDPYLCADSWADVLTRPAGVCGGAGATAEATDMMMTPEATAGS
ncbi:MAG TPA: urea ABC transporter substrate-binding protein [Phototrophicaceae bacterium]|nr:urea ABC transporter substrate-binding protein [Phototrophicaceae bacterium]